MATRPEQIHPERRTLYYTAVTIITIGVVLLVSAFVTGATRFGSFDHFAGPTMSEVIRAVGGVALIAGGIFALQSTSDA
jgi:hypothetical protein